MGKAVTIGGDRLGSGKQMKTYLHNYNRSTHNLSYKFASSLAPGILYPFMIIPAMRGDSFSIDLEAAARTIPTRGPLFGSYKLQLDVFQCPFRLYQAILHNNPTAIGLRMNQVKLPRIEFKHTYDHSNKLDMKFSNSCLMKYLGISGLGTARNAQNGETLSRQFNAIPVLAYYDIFKNYYSNKQEEFAYVINATETNIGGDSSIRVRGTEISDETEYEFEYFTNNVLITGLRPEDVTLRLTYDQDVTFESLTIAEAVRLNRGYIQNYAYDGSNIRFTLVQTQPDYFNYYSFDWESDNLQISSLVIEKFELANIDNMRMNILSHNNLGTPFVIDEDYTEAPYNVLTAQGSVTGKTMNVYPHVGLCLKTYQSDIFNNWVNTEWIDGTNGIAEITKISTAGDSFKIDALNLAEKLYNMLNRVAVSGATYEDWQDAVYTQSPRRHIESPVYLGGLSSEVVFEEIVQTTPSNIDGEVDALGTLGGRGTLLKRKGGNVDVKCDEASFIIGIVSLTPRVFYTQFNEWYMTELDTMDDLHKPALDGIGFENLIGERMAWFDTKMNNAGTQWVRHSVGKLPAWINYMTNFDKAYGDFADVNGKGFMILNRNYEFDGNNDAPSPIKDATTYIDPRKYNYAFAYTDLDAQNFWVQINSKIIARRLMSAKQIPNV